MIKFLKSFGLGIAFGMGFFLIALIGYWGIKARQTTNPALTDSDPAALYVNTNETLSSAKRNSLVDTAYYPKYVTKTQSAQFSTTSTSYVTDATMNTDIAVKKGDLILVILNGSMESSTAGYSVYARLKLISGDGTWIDTPVDALGSQYVRHPFAFTGLIKANTNGILTFGYEAKINGAATAWISNAVLKAIVIGKTN